MSRLEDELRIALRREEPPAGFAARVLARASAEAAAGPETLGERLARWFTLPSLRLAVAATLCLAVVVGVQQERAERERVQGEAAKKQLLIALQVTGSALHSVRGKVQRISELERP